MKTNTIAVAVLASALLLPLAACSQSAQDNTSTSAASNATQVAKDAPPATSMIAAEVRKGMAKAKQELVTQDISLGNIHFGDHDHGHHRDDSRPKAAITPQGDLLIAGKKIDATPEQHTLLLDYRQQIIGIAETGMDIGASGADIGVAAAKQAIWGAFTGKSDQQIEASIKPQTDAIQAAAMQLCKRLPAMLASQQKLAAAMPAFQPYATMTQKDVDDCGKDVDKNGKKGVAVFSD